MCPQFSLGLGKMHFRKKNFRNHKSVGAGARKVENVVRLLRNFDLYFLNIRRAREGYKMHIGGIGKYYKNIEIIKIVKIATLFMYIGIFSFCLKG